MVQRITIEKCAARVGSRNFGELGDAMGRLYNSRVKAPLVSEAQAPIWWFDPQSIGASSNRSSPVILDEVFV